MFVVIRYYHFNSKDGAEVDHRIREEFVPLTKSAKGSSYRKEKGRRKN